MADAVEGHLETWIPSKKEAWQNVLEIKEEVNGMLLIHLRLLGMNIYTV